MGDSVPALKPAIGKDYNSMQDLTTRDTTKLTASFPLSDASPKDKPWDTHRKNADQVRDLYAKAQYERYAERISECSQRLEFALHRIQFTGELQFKLHQAKFCRVRLCPVCQWRRSMMWRARFFQALPKLQEDYPTARFIFLTLTVKDCPLEDLRATVSHMNKAWGKLVKRKAFPAQGWVKSVEVTRDRDGLAHPHFHAVLMVQPGYFVGKNYLSQAKWTELWKSCLRVDYNPIVNVKTVKPKKGKDGIFIALCETLKYSVKETDLTLDIEWLKGLTHQLYKTRAVAVGGVFKNYLSEDEPEDLIHTDLDDEEATLEDRKFWFSWREMTQKYMSE